MSETVVLQNGDFLIRDSLINVGDYVLTTRWNYEVLHFKITKVLVRSSTESKVCIVNLHNLHHVVGSNFTVLKDLVIFGGKTIITVKLFKIQRIPEDDT